MEKLIVLTIFFVLLLTIPGTSQKINRGDIFSDDFEKDSSELWLDMKAWGFGVWQIKGGKFISIDSNNVTQQMLAALPKFDNAIVNRDYTVTFRYKPTSGTSYTFTIDARQQGWGSYKFEISQDGSISIIKSLIVM